MAGKPWFAVVQNTDGSVSITGSALMMRKLCRDAEQGVFAMRGFMAERGLPEKAQKEVTGDEGEYLRIARLLEKLGQKGNEGK